MCIFFWNVRIIIFFWHYLPSPIKVFPSNSTEILKVGIWTGPSWPTTLYSMPGFSSFKAKHGLFMGWNAGLVLPGDFFLFDLLLPGLWSSGKCGFLSAPPPFFSGPSDLKSIDSYEKKKESKIFLDNIDNKTDNSLLWSPVCLDFSSLPFWACILEL